MQVEPISPFALPIPAGGGGWWDGAGADSYGSKKVRSSLFILNSVQFAYFRRNFILICSWNRFFREFHPIYIFPTEVRTDANRSEPRNWLFRSVRNPSEWSIFSEKFRNKNSQNSAEFRGSEILSSTLHLGKIMQATTMKMVSVLHYRQSFPWKNCSSLALSTQTF